MKGDARVRMAAFVAGLAGVFPPDSAREHLPVLRTELLIVLTAASPARKLSSFTSANTRTSGFSLVSKTFGSSLPECPRHL